MDFKSHAEAREWLEKALEATCSDCGGSGRATVVSPVTDQKLTTRCSACEGRGWIQSFLGSALVEWIGEQLEEKFAEKRHGHCFSGGTD